MIDMIMGSFHQNLPRLDLNSAAPVTILTLVAHSLSMYSLCGDVPSPFAIVHARLGHVLHDLVLFAREALPYFRPLQIICQEVFVCEH